MMGEREREGESDGECSSCDKKERKQKKKWWWSNQIPKQFRSFFPCICGRMKCVCTVQFGQKTEILSSNVVSGNLDAAKKASVKLLLSCQGNEEDEWMTDFKKRKKKEKIALPSRL